MNPTDWRNVGVVARQNLKPLFHQKLHSCWVSKREGKRDKLRDALENFQ